MKELASCLLLTATLISSIPARAQSYSGVFLTGNGEGLIGGNIHLTLDGNQALFQSTLFSYWTVGTRLEPVWQLSGMEIQFDLGNGTPGTWELGEFLGPIVGLNPIPPEEEPIDPGFYLPAYEEGVRYSGSFTVPDELAAALANGPGILRMQTIGSVIVGGSTVQNPLLSAALVVVPEPSSAVLLATGAAALLYRKRTGMGCA